MKDQIAALMEALRLIEIEVGRFKRGQQNGDTTVRAIERAVSDPKVSSAIRSIEPFMDAPSVVPQDEELHHA